MPPANSADNINKSGKITKMTHGIQNLSEETFSQFTYVSHWFTKVAIFVIGRIK